MENNPSQRDSTLGNTPIMTQQNSPKSFSTLEARDKNTKHTGQDQENVDLDTKEDRKRDLSRQNSRERNRTSRGSWDVDISQQKDNQDPAHAGLTRRDSFEDAILYPRPKEGSKSPTVPSGSGSLVTPDEIFGPMSPRRSISFDGAASRGGNTASRADSKRTSRVVRSNSRKYSRARTLSPSDEAPLRSMSRFEPASRHIDRSNNSRVNGNIRVDDKDAATNNKTMSALSRQSHDRRSERSFDNSSRKIKLYNNMSSSPNGVEEGSGLLNTTTVSIERNKFTDQLYSSKMDRRYVSRLNALSRGSSYYHGDIVDDNLLISATKLDSTLIRLFSDPNPQDKNYREQPGTLLLPYADYAQSDLISLDPVKWRVQPMRSSHKEALDHELSFIEENLTPRDLIKKLYEEEVLTLMDYNQLTRTEGQGERAVTRLLVRTLQRRGHKAYPTFVRTLENFGYNHVSNKLNETELFIRTGMEKDRESYERSSRMEQMKHQQALDFDKTFIKKSHFSPRGHIGNSDPLIRTTPDTFTTPTNGHTMMASTHSPRRSDNNQSGLRPSVSRASSSPEKIGYPKDIEQHLQGLNAELKALHDDVTALKTSRRQSQSAQKPSEEDTQVKKDHRDKAQKSGSCTLL
ncbi:uncharacterized protein LOC101859780 [Aplysia californica]|uniref:Uncharacterized protein LOC101859780 n=1 Tax=Aplysia californica TaxID=6500 RepID=A0ABM0JLZ4_APLCA|nr:uncharacterized protein LOC101859780 [Aplysia californica]